LNCINLKVARQQFLAALPLNGVTIPIFPISLHKLVYIYRHELAFYDFRGSDYRVTRSKNIYTN